MKANGNMAFGYTADYSNLDGFGSHAEPSGNGDLSGYYYAPGFVSFDVQPFYNESRSKLQLSIYISVERREWHCGSISRAVISRGQSVTARFTTAKGDCLFREWET